MLFLGKAQLNRKLSSPLTSLSIPPCLSIHLKTTEKSGTLCFQRLVYIIQGFHQLQPVLFLSGSQSMETATLRKKKKENQTLTAWLRNRNVSEFWGAGGPRTGRLMTVQAYGGHLLSMSSCTLGVLFKRHSPHLQGLHPHKLITTQSTASHHIKGWVSLCQCVGRPPGHSD